LTGRVLVYMISEAHSFLPYHCQARPECSDGTRRSNLQSPPRLLHLVRNDRWEVSLPCRSLSWARRDSSPSLRSGLRLIRSEWQKAEELAMTIHIVVAGFIPAYCRNGIKGCLKCPLSIWTRSYLRGSLPPKLQDESTILPSAPGSEQTVLPRHRVTFSIPTQWGSGPTKDSYTLIAWGQDATADSSTKKWRVS